MNTYQRFQIPMGFAQKYCSEGSSNSFAVTFPFLFISIQRTQFILSLCRFSYIKYLRN